ncbi:MAG: putative serine protease HtrA [Parcubacteria bacterium OLB19]|nr:MAG: putative serine protease HtrA [Parcubacteria bacterium OLB19]
MISRQLLLGIVVSSLVTTTVLIGTLYVFKDKLIPIPTDIHFNENTTSPLQTENDLVVEMIEKVNPAVVSVVVTKDVPIYERYYEEFDPWGWFGGGISIPRTREKGTEEREVGGGSGFIVSSDGLIVTNRHVVSDSEARYSILMNDGKAYAVEVLARDMQLDIAVLKITDLPSDVKLSYLSFGDSEKLKLGQRVVAIGNALAEFRNSVSVGVVSGLARSITATDDAGRSENLDQVIQTDAAINPGNSGGPLLNIQGEVIGVNVATSRGADNIGFALPAHVVKGVVESVKENGKIVRPFLGIRYTMINKELQEKNNMSVDYGALVARGKDEGELAVMPGSPADKAGIVENDIILEIDGEKLQNRDLATVLRAKNVGDLIKVKVLHKGNEEEKEVELGEMP